MRTMLTLPAILAVACTLATAPSATAETVTEPRETSSQRADRTPGERTAAGKRARARRQDDKDKTCECTSFTIDRLEPGSEIEFDDAISYEFIIPMTLKCSEGKRARCMGSATVTGKVKDGDAPVEVQTLVDPEDPAAAISCPGKCGKTTKAHRAFAVAVDPEAGETEVTITIAYGCGSDADETWHERTYTLTFDGGEFIEADSDLEGKPKEAKKPKK